MSTYQSYREAENAYNNDPTPYNEAVITLLQVQWVGFFVAPKRKKWSKNIESYKQYRKELLEKLDLVAGFEAEKTIIKESFKKSVIR